MQLKYFLAASAASLSMAAGLAAPAHAQQITSGIEGNVTDANGATISGASVVITDTRTGSVRRLTTSADGYFRADSLVTGGPYTVTATAPGFEGQTVNNVNINLSGNTSLSFELSAGADDNIIVVTATQAGVSQLAIGPGTSFGAEELEAFPSITRDIRDIIRIDPRVSLDRSNEVDRISCLGGNDRSNAFTVDGIAQSDNFGLNGTPFASRNNLPLPYDVIAETSVEFAPFDVQYGAFTGCAINVVTKSGTNDFHGTAFFTYTGDGLTGDTVDGVDVTPAPFDRYRWGATLSGPVFKDRLFFTFGYEETDLGDSQDDGPIGAGFANELGFITTEQFNEISTILQNSYGIDTGGIARSLPESSRRFFGRGDLYINDDHRLEVTYQRLEEENVEPDDLNTSNFTGLNTFEVEGTESDYYSARLYSNWTDNFSTEVRLSRSDVQDIQGPVGGGEAQSDNPIPRIIVGVINPANGNIGSVQAGPGFSRTSNELNTRITQGKVQGNLLAGNHSLTLGVEVNELRVFNLFAQNSTGTLTFANVTDLRNGVLSGGTNTFPSAAAILSGQAAGAYGNFTASGDINDAAATFKRTIFSVYGQDDWQATSQLNLLLGLRVDWYDGDGATQNPAFFDRYGFSNSTPFSKLDPVLLPRFGFTYNVENEGFFRGTQIKGGAGIFTGGDPTVYFSNAFSNNGFAVGFGASDNAACDSAEGADGRIDVLQNGQFTGVPQCIVTVGGQQSARGLADTQSTDPDFKSPTVIRANLGFATEFGTGGGFFDDWRLNVDYIYSHFKNPIDFVDLSQVVNPSVGLSGFTIDGRPIYAAIEPTRAGCNAQLQNQGGIPLTYTGVTPACFGTSRDDEIQLTNGASYDSHVASVILSKRFDRGLLTDGGGINFSLGYAFTDANSNRYNNSSTATSSYDIVASADRQNNAIATSEYETRHNFTLGLNVREQFFGDYDTQFGFVFVARSGRPYSATFDNGGIFNDSASGSDNALLYVPTGPGDPNVVYTNTLAGTRVIQTAAEAESGFNSYIDANKCIAKFRGQTLPRNSCRSESFYDLDLRFSQEIPGPGRFFGVEDKIKLYADFDNFLNLIDSGANVFRRQEYTTAIINAQRPDGQGRYVLNGFFPDDLNRIQTSSSLWRIQVGVSYAF